MADIASYLNDIKNAIFGKEVRGSIHDGIKVMNDEVEKTTSRQEYLEATFDELIINEGNSNAEIVAARVEAGGKSYKKLGDRLNNFDEQFNTIENITLPNLDDKRYKITRETKKTFDDACVVNINNTGKPAEVGGFRKDSELSLVADRDSVIAYIDGTLPQCKILEVVNFTENSVEVVGDISNVEEGIIIDCMNLSEIEDFYQETKYSGFVTRTEGNKIFVSGWYQFGNSSSGQIPNKDRIIINPVTKMWNINANLFLEPTSFGWGGVIGEFGLFNRKSKATGHEYYKLGGIDMVNFEGVTEFGYQIRNANNDETTKTYVGFQAEGAEVGFNSKVKDNKTAFQTDNGNFKVNGFGVHNNLLLNSKIYADNATIEPYSAYFHIVNSGNHSLPNPADFSFASIKILAQNNCNVIGNMFTSTGDLSSYELRAWRTLELFSNGDKWYVIY